jgi:hypothetical protein
VAYVICILVTRDKSGKNCPGDNSLGLYFLKNFCFKLSHSNSNISLGEVGGKSQSSSQRNLIIHFLKYSSKSFFISLTE